MSTIRQNNLYVAGDWKVVYNAFRNVNLQSYDYQSIYDSLVRYIRINNPEEFNDYIRHGEMMLHVNMIAYLGQSLAFRLDLNIRENFFDTAERRDSVLKLAKMLSYKPKRNRAANGLCKIVSVKTSQPIINSRGENLSQREISWNQQNNISWYDDFVRVINSAVTPSNRVGEPVKEAMIDGIKTDVYSIATSARQNTVYNFSADVNGTSYPFEVVSVDLQDNNYTEAYPDNKSNFNILYRNDKNGVTSVNNGFFTYFKQGTLSFSDYQYDTPENDRVALIDEPDINETDVWLQAIDNTGTVIKNWTKVPSLVGQNIVYNNIFLKERDIYATETTDDNGVIIRYSDGEFGNIPLGLFRVWYRQSENDSYIIRPNDITNQTITIPYIGNDNQTYQLTIKFSLLTTVDNAEPQEDIEQIRTNAPLSYYTQDRMVNGEDYNVYPITQTNLIKKIKTVNRTHAGHSRFIDIHDPTGTHSNVNVMGDDGYIIMKDDYKSSEAPIQYNTNYKSLVYTHIEKLISGYNFKMYYYHELRKNILNDSKYGKDFLSAKKDTVKWVSLPNNSTSNTGYFINENGDNILVASSGINDFNKMLRDNTKILFIDDTGKETWVTIKSVSYDGSVDTSYMNRGSIELTGNIKTGSYISEIVPGLRGHINIDEMEGLVDELVNNRHFGLWYDFIEDKWNIIAQDNIISIDNTHDFEEPEYPSQADNRWLLNAIVVQDSTDLKYKFEVRGSSYIFGSDKQVRFFFNGDYSKDYIKILESNTDRINLNGETFTRADIGTLYTSESHSNQLGYDITLLFPPSMDVSEVKFKTGNTEIENFEIVQDGAYTAVIFDDISLPDNTVKTIRISNNVKIDTTVTRLKRPYDFTMVDKFIRDDGVVDYSKVYIEPRDSDRDGIADYPLAIEDIVDMNNKVFFKTQFDFDGRMYDKVTFNVNYLYEDTTIWNNRIYFCDKTVSIKDIDGVLIEYEGGHFYRGEDIEKETSLEVNRASLLVNGLDTVDMGTYSWYYGRTFNEDDKLYYHWKHFASVDERIDPSISNIMDMYVLTKSYDTSVRTWIKDRLDIEDFPITPSSNELKSNLRFIEQNKTTSDQIIYIPAEYKLVFGNTADPMYRAKFKVVKALGTNLTDNEIKSKIIKTFDDFFNIDNWQFGDTFYYTELVAYVHSKLIGIISSMVVVPDNKQSVFGDLFEITSEPNQLILSTATVENIDIVSSYTDTNIKRR